MIKKVFLTVILAQTLVGCSGDESGSGKSAEPVGAKSPQEVLTQFTRHLYGGQSVQACALITDGGRQAIATSTGQGYCPAGIAKIIETKTQVKLAKYKNWAFDEPDNLKVIGDTAVYDGNCSGGPLHNVKFNLTKTEPGWMISGWEEQLGYVCGG
ncbi:hypothetical protein ACGFNU_08895 [Spirillospora sp. NPDC048911]|uniref:hypothetical protein n=1 Tax=Spirillospora sp. NPDC048911 TaxID=3364527 RepID=UPI00372304EF